MFFLSSVYNSTSPIDTTEPSRQDGYLEEMSVRVKDGSTVDKDAVKQIMKESCNKIEALGAQDPEWNPQPRRFQSTVKTVNGSILITVRQKKDPLETVDVLTDDENVDEDTEEQVLGEGFSSVTQQLFEKVKCSYYSCH